MRHTKFQVSSTPGTCFSKIEIWPKSAVNPCFKCTIGPASDFFTLLGFDFGVMLGCFPDVSGLPYRLASLLIYIHLVLIPASINSINGVMKYSRVHSMILYKNYASEFYFKPYLLYRSQCCILPIHYVRKIFFSVNHAHSL